MKSNNCLDSFFKKVTDHLKNDFLFIFDYWYGPAVLNLKPSNRIKEIKNEDFQLIRKYNSELDSFHSQVTVNYEVGFIPNSTKLKEIYDEKHKKRYLFLNQIDLLAKKYVFQVLKYAKWINFSKLSIKDWNALTILKKK